MTNAALNDETHLEGVKAKTIVANSHVLFLKVLQDGLDPNILGWYECQARTSSHDDLLPYICHNIILYYC